MYSLETFGKLNSIEDKNARLKKIRTLLKRKPMKWIKSVSDVKGSPDYTGLKINDIEEASGREFIDEYFVDSSGMGRSNEPAMTFNMLQENIKNEQENRKGERLYSVLTGVGQFQVYVSLFSSKKGEKNVR